MSREVGDFARSLRRLGLAERFYPLRPLEALDRTDLGGGVRPMLRRRLRMAWRRLGELLHWIDARSRRFWLYRLLRRAVNTALAEKHRNTR